jgi:hypothetical protein
MISKGFNAIVLATAENVQYLSGVTEPSIRACGTIIIPKQSQPILAVLWLDKESAKEQATDRSTPAYCGSKCSSNHTRAGNGSIPKTRIGLQIRSIMEAVIIPALASIELPPYPDKLHKNNQKEVQSNGACFNKHVALGKRQNRVISAK